MELREKENLLYKIINSKWNSHDSTQKMITSFFKKGGFQNLLNFVKKEKERLGKEFESWYSADLIEDLTQAQMISEDEFKHFLKIRNFGFNSNNFKKLDDANLLNNFYAFYTDFRGNISNIHRIAQYCIIETIKDKERHFYDYSDLNTVFDSLESALIYRIYNGKYYDTLITLLNAK